MLLGAVEKERSFPQFRGGFPLPFAEIIRLRGESVVLDFGVFGDLTRSFLDEPSGGQGLS